MDESELESIWMTDILPIVGERMIPASHPITVFLGGPVSYTHLTLPTT